MTAEFKLFTCCDGLCMTQIRACARAMQLGAEQGAPSTFRDIDILMVWISAWLTLKRQHTTGGTQNEYIKYDKCLIQDRECLYNTDARAGQISWQYIHRSQNISDRLHGFKLGLNLPPEQRCQLYGRSQ